MAKHTDRAWDPDALEELAHMVEAAVTRQGSANKLAQASGVAPNTIGSLRKNRGEYTVQRPSEKTLTQLAPFLVNPLSKGPFLPKELVDFCKGYYGLDPGSIESLQEYWDNFSAKSGLTAAEVAKSIGVSEDRLLEFIDNPESVENIGKRMAFLVFLSAKIGNTIYLAKLAGIDISLEGIRQAQ